jgi:hypothetical protein
VALGNAHSEKCIKNEMRNRMGQERLNMLSLMNIKNETLHAVDCSTELIINLRQSTWSRPVNSDFHRKVFEY